MSSGNPYVDIFVAIGKAVYKFFTHPAVQLTMFVASGVNAHIKTQELKKTGQEILLTKFGTGGAMPVIYGTRRVAGTVVYMNTAQYQKELFVVYAIAGHEIDSFNLETLQIDGRPVSDVQIYRDGFIASDGTTRITSSGGRGTKASGNFFGSTQTEINNVLAGTNPPNRPRMVFNCHTGSTTQAADPMLVGCVDSWTTDHKLSGIAYIACNFEYDIRGQFTGLPNLTVVVNGKKLYDPRADGSITGGTGSQRANDASTHTWSANPSLALLDYMTDDDYGKGLDPTETTGDIDLGSFQTAADACDVSADTEDHDNVVVESANTSTDVVKIANANQADFNNFKIGSTFTVTDGVTTYINNKRLIDKDIGQITDETDTAVAILQLIFEDGAVDTAITTNTTCTFTETQVKFDCHGVIDTEESVLDNTKALVANMRGIFTYSNGQYAIKVEGAESSVVSLDEDDIFESGLNLSLENKEAKYNKVEAEFYNAQKRYETDTTYYTGETTDDFLTDDGDEILETRIQLPFCTNQRIAYNHAKALLKRSRSQKTVAFVATPKVLQAKVGEVITITSSNMGLSNALFRITNMVINPDLNIEVTAIEYQTDIYDYVTPPDESIGVINDPVDGNRVEAPTNLQFTAKDTSTGEPAKLTWTDSSKYPSYEFRVVVKTGNTSTIPNKTRFDRRTQETFFYLDGINIDSGFTAFVSALNSLGVESDAEELAFAVTTAPVTTPDIEQGSIGGFNFTATKMYYGTAGNFNNTDTAVYFDNAGQFSLKDKLSWNGTTLDISGNLTVENTITADKIVVDGINLDNLISASTQSGSIYLTEFTGIKIATSGSTSGYPPLLKLQDDTATDRFTDITQSQTGINIRARAGTTKGTIRFQGRDSGITPVNYGGFDSDGNWEIGTTDVIKSTRDIESVQSIALDSNTPSTTTNKLYQASGTLYWNGNQVGVGAINSVTNMADNRVLTASGSNSANGEANLTFDGSTLAVTGSQTISGDLTVNGTTVTLNTATLDVEDKNITLNYSIGDSSASANGAGITIQDAVDASTDATILWNSGNDRFDFSHTVQTSGGFISSSSSTFNDDVTFTGAGSDMTWDNSADKLNFDDNTKATFGNSDDLQIYHDGTSSYIKDAGTGILNLLGSGSVRIKGSTDEELLARFNENGSVQLYYDTDEKLATTSTGIDVTGTISSGAITSSGKITSTADGSEGGHLLLRANSGGAKQYSWDVDGANAFRMICEDDGTGDNGFVIMKTGSSGQNIRFQKPLRMINTEFIDINRNLTNIGTISASQTLSLNASGTNDTSIEIGASTASNHYAFIDLVGDATYSDYGLRIIRNNGGANTSSFIYHRGTGNFNIETQDSAAIKLRTAGTDALTVDTSQRVGIGTPSPSSTLHLANSSGVSLRLEDTGSHNFRMVCENGVNSLNFKEGSGNTILSLEGSNRRVGIGTTSPDDELHIRSTAQAGAGLRLENSNTSTDNNTVYGTINFEGNDASAGASGIRGSIVGGSDNATGAMSLEFSTASGGGSNTERLRITSSGETIFKPTGSEVGRVTSSGFTTTGSYSATGNFNTSVGGYQINGATVIDNSTNITSTGDNISLHSFKSYNTSADKTFTIGTSNRTAVNNNDLFAYFLNVSGAASGQDLKLKAKRRLTSSTDDERHIFHYDASAEAQKFFTADTERFRIDGSGGTRFKPDGTNELVKIIGGTSYNENIRMHPSSNGYGSLVLGAVSGDSGTGVGQWTLVRYPDANANLFTIRHNSTNHLAIKKTGEVGIGKDNPAQKLDVQGNIGVGGAEVISSSRNLVNIQSITSAGTHQITSVSTSFNPFLVRYNSTYSNNNLARIRQDGAESIFNLYNSAGTSEVQFGTNTNNYFLNGNTGIGLNNPTEKFQVQGNIRASGAYKIGNNVIAEQQGSILYFGDRNDNDYTVHIQGFSDSSNIVLNDGFIDFGTGSTAMRLDSSQRAYFGTTSNPTANATGALNVLADTGDGINVKHTINGNNCVNLWQTGTSAANLIAFYKGNTQIPVGNIRVTTSSTSYNTSSDYRLKENVTDMTGALSRVNQLQPKRFNFINDDTDTLVDGFLAHEVSDIVPEAITGTKDEVDDDGNPVYQGIDQAKLVPLLVKAIQEQQAQIEALQEQINNI